MTPHWGRSVSVRPSVRVYHLPSPPSSDPEEVEPASPRWPQTPSSAEVGLASNTQGEASTQTLSSARGIRAACPRPLGTRPTPELRLRRQSARVAPTGVSEAGVLPISTMLEAQVQLLHQPHRTEGPWSLLPGDSPPPGSRRHCSSRNVLWYRVLLRGTAPVFVR